MEKIQKFFLEIREGDEATKKRWLIILTSISMVVVVIFWSLYISISVPQLGSSSKNNAAESGSFTGTISSAVGLAAKNLGLKLNYSIDKLKTLAQRTNSITIEGASFNFVAGGLQEVRPKKLP